MKPLLDTHFHFDFIKGESNRRQFLCDLKTNQLEIVAQTVLPSQYVRLLKESIHPQKVALGFHPWWIENEGQAQKEIAIFERTVHSTHFIGEIGLDFSYKRLAVSSQTLQIEIFKQLLELVIKASQTHTQPTILSIHTVRSTTTVLDCFEELAVLEQGIVPIIHWFSGTSEELTRLIKLGCYLSINPKMLETKKGRAYVKQVPAERLLLETDWPSSEVQTVESVTPLSHEMGQVLSKIVITLSELRGEAMLPVIIANQERLFD